ncbi:AEC family transporter [Alicyclobacillus dauci]|uniref:AEC family transporter n=1 Tax=Alicyclobacillus dauci TaxID=1475485 RepID=A0ABY6Z5Q5_9BACL|nr:AEC family transporter [Alicyclobacillus dauci]WAH38080.1 AEC family transporter [Alicyclobacillus dauci]
MTNYVHLLGNVTLPILLVCLFGAVLHRWKRVDTGTLADVGLYILAPCLMITALTDTHVSGGNLLAVLGFTIVDTILCWGAALLFSWMFRLQPDTVAATTLTTIFGNANNYGLPVLLLAFGTSGFSLGATYVVGQIILVNTLGMYVASRSTGTIRQSFTQILKAPLIYAAIMGLILYALRLHLPGSIDTTFRLVGNAYPVIVLLILGIQLSKMKWSGVRHRGVWVAVGLRIVLVPLISITTLKLLGIHGLLAAVLFVESSMPAAVNTIVLVEKYGGNKDVAALTVAITTVVSFLTLPFLIHIHVV